MTVAKRILITGASSGIGRETALQLAKNGHYLVLAARREDLLMSLAAECLHLGAIGAVPVPCDIGIQSDVQRAALALGELPDTLEPCLINNAGHAEFGPIIDVSPESLVAQINVNLTGAMLLTQTVLPLMIGGGRILNVLSIAAEVAFPGAAAYSAAKAGLRQFGKCIQAEYRHQGVVVTNILPGATRTGIWGTGGPNPTDMIPPAAIAETLVWLIEQPMDRSIDEITVMPPKGVL